MCRSAIGMPLRSASRYASSCTITTAGETRRAHHGLLGVPPGRAGPLADDIRHQHHAGPVQPQRGRQPGVVEDQCAPAGSGGLQRAVQVLPGRVRHCRQVHGLAQQQRRGARRRHRRPRPDDVHSGHSTEDVHSGPDVDVQDRGRQFRQPVPVEARFPRSHGVGQEAKRREGSGVARGRDAGVGVTAQRQHRVDGAGQRLVRMAGETGPVRTAERPRRLDRLTAARYASARPGGPATSEALAASAGRPAARRTAAKPAAACALAPMPNASSRPVPSIAGTGQSASAARTVAIERARISGCARTTARKSSVTP